MLAGAEDHLATFSFPGVSQTIVQSSTWGQCPQVLPGTAQKVAKSTRLCSYTSPPFRYPPPPSKKSPTIPGIFPEDSDSYLDTIFSAHPEGIFGEPLHVLCFTGFWGGFQDSAGASMQTRAPQANSSSTGKSAEKSVEKSAKRFAAEFKNLLMPLFLMGCFTVDFQEVKRPLRAKTVKRPIKVGKRPINEGKRPIKAMVLVGISVGCLMGCFRSPPPWQKTAPLKRPIKRSMKSPPEKFAA